MPDTSTAFSPSKCPFPISAQQIKDATKHFSKTGMREVRILCKQDCREARPSVFKDAGLFLLPVKNGHYVIVKGEGYIDIPEVPKSTTIYLSRFLVSKKEEDMKKHSNPTYTF